MAKTAAWNLAHTNVRVNSICPGLIEVRPVYDDDQYRAMGS